MGRTGGLAGESWSALPLPARGHPPCYLHMCFQLSESCPSTSACVCLKPLLSMEGPQIRHAEMIWLHDYLTCAATWCQDDSPAVDPVLAVNRAHSKVLLCLVVVQYHPIWSKVTARTGELTSVHMQRHLMKVKNRRSLSGQQEFVSPEAQASRSLSLKPLSLAQPSRLSSILAP